MQYNGLSKATIPMLEAIPGNGALAYARNVILARAYAAEGRFEDAADTLLNIKDESQVTRRSVEDAARLLRSAS